MQHSWFPFKKHPLLDSLSITSLISKEWVKNEWIINEVDCSWLLFTICLFWCLLSPKSLYMCEMYMIDCLLYLPFQKNIIRKRVIFKKNHQWSPFRKLVSQAVCRNSYSGPTLALSGWGCRQTLLAYCPPEASDHQFGERWATSKMWRSRKEAVTQCQKISCQKVMSLNPSARNIFHPCTVKVYWVSSRYGSCTWWIRDVKFISCYMWQMYLNQINTFEKRINQQSTSLSTRHLNCNGNNRTRKCLWLISWWHLNCNGNKRLIAFLPDVAAARWRAGSAVARFPSKPRAGCDPGSGKWWSRKWTNQISHQIRVKEIWPRLDVPKNYSSNLYSQLPQSALPSLYFDHLMCWVGNS